MFYHASEAMTFLRGEDSMQTTNGFLAWSLLSILDDNDLALIEMHNDLTILPGHRKKLLLAAKQMSCKVYEKANTVNQVARTFTSSLLKAAASERGAFDLAASQLSTGANSKARKQLDAQGAALQRYVVALLRHF
eukprot:823000-Pelagomonas_calceolata.AAC.1